MVTALAFGLAIGLAFGMLGGGGSVLAMPVLVYALGESVHAATTGSLVVVAAAALAGGLGHSRRGGVCWKHAAVFAGSAIGGILVGTLANQKVGGDLLLALFVPVMLLGAWATWRRAVADDGRCQERVACPPVSVRRDAVAGNAVGLLTGFFGVGGGFVVVPTLALALGFPVRRAIGTSLVIVSAVSLSALALHLAAGNELDGGITAAMAAACAASAFAGGRLAGHFSHPALARGFALLVTGVAACMFVATVFGL
jgi:uncharacterized protein